jgi:hypothetical protein
MQIIPPTPKKKIWVLEQLTDPQQAAWVADWLLAMRTARTARTEAMRALQISEARDQADKARAAAIQRMSTPGSREVKRWLGGSVEPVSLHFLKANHPDTLLTNILPAAIKTALIEASATCAERYTDTNSTLLIEGIRPSHCVFLLRILEGLPCTLQCRNPDRLLSDPADKLAIWEHHLGKEALAQRLDVLFATGNNCTPWPR